MKFRRTGENEFTLYAECNWEHTLFLLLQNSHALHDIDSVLGSNRSLIIHCDSDYTIYDVFEDIAEELKEEAKNWDSYRTHFMVWDKEGELCV